MFNVPTQLCPLCCLQSGSSDDELVEENNEDLLSKIDRSDASLMIHEIHNKIKWLKVECMDSLTIEQITTPERYVARVSQL